jgi:chromosome segregation ATPase
MSEQEWAEVPKMQLVDEVRSLRAALAQKEAEIVWSEAHLEYIARDVARFCSRIAEEKVRAEKAEAELAECRGRSGGFIRSLQEKDAMLAKSEAELAEARKQIELLKSDLGIAHRVCERAEDKMKDAVRIGCENITSREKSESQLAESEKRLDRESDDHQDTLKKYHALARELAALRAAAEQMAKDLEAWVYRGPALAEYRKLGDSPTVGVAEKKGGGEC